MTDKLPIARSPYAQGRTWHWKDRLASCGPEPGSIAEWTAARWAMGGYFRTPQGGLGINCDVRYRPCVAPQPSTFYGQTNEDRR